MRLSVSGQTIWPSFRPRVASVIASAQVEAKRRLDRTALGYCLECRKKVEIQNPRRVTFTKNPPAAKDVCPKCGTKVFLISRA